MDSQRGAHAVDSLVWRSVTQWCTSRRLTWDAVGPDGARRSQCQSSRLESAPPPPSRTRVCGPILVLGPRPRTGRCVCQAAGAIPPPARRVLIRASIRTQGRAGALAVPVPRGVSRAERVLGLDSQTVFAAWRSGAGGSRSARAAGRLTYQLLKPTGFFRDEPRTSVRADLRRLETPPPVVAPRELKLAAHSG